MNKLNSILLSIQARSGSQNILSMFNLLILIKKILVVGGIEPPENEQNKQGIKQTHPLITITRTTNTEKK